MSSQLPARATIKISASILAADFSNLGEAVRDATNAHADSIHIDFMDGHYVRNLTFGLDLIPALRCHTHLPLVAHLEIENPDALVSDFARAGADMIIVCEDTCPNLGATIQAVRSAGMQVGVSLHPDRPLSLVTDYVDQLDLLLILAVPPGFGGQKLMPSVLPKIADARRLIDTTGKPTGLGVDGGINCETVAQVVQAGADTLIVGMAIYRGNVAENISVLRHLAISAR